MVAIIDNSRIAELGKVSDIFADPKSAIGKNLILSDTVSHREVKGGRMLRIVFDGRNSLEPVISNMILSCKVPVNILHASTKDIQGTAHGHMIIQLPEDELSFGRLTNYLRSVSIAFEEVTSHES